VSADIFIILFTLATDLVSTLLGILFSMYADDFLNGLVNGIAQNLFFNGTCIAIFLFLTMISCTSESANSEAYCFLFLSGIQFLMGCASTRWYEMDWVKENDGDRSDPDWATVLVWAFWVD
jgi:hypothetical protein